MKLKTVQIVSWCLLGLMMIFFVLMGASRRMLFGYCVIGTLIAYGIFNLSFWRCPYCRKPLGALAGFRYCRHCGAKIEL